MFGRRPVATSRSAALDGLLAVAGFEHDLDPAGAARRTRSTLTPLRIVTPSRASCVEHDRGAFRVVLGERLRRLQHGDLGAEPAERLRQLEPDRAAADDDEMLGPLAQLEDGLVGEIRRLRRARESAAPPAASRWRSRSGAP